MKTLILQRHARSEKAADADFYRALTPEGVADAAARGEELARRSIVPDLILHSSALRARQTAEIAAAALGVPDALLTADAELYSADADTLLAILHNLPDDADTVLVVAHNPAVEIAADALCDSQPGHFRPSEAVILTFDAADWSTIGSARCKTAEMLLLR